VPDVVGYRGKFAAICPSTNTVVEHDFNMMAPPGITIHTGRFLIERPALASDEEFIDLINQVLKNMGTAIQYVKTCKPDYYVMGMSAGTFWNGIAGSKDFERQVLEHSGGVACSTGSTATSEALRAYGIKKISVLTPYQPVADREVANYFTEAGFDVVKSRGLKCPSATAIAEVTEAELVGVLEDMNVADCDAIVQCGTNLSMVKLAAEAEKFFRKPVIAINTATLWHALRTYGIDDKIRGFGRLMEEF
jgi:maleate isomerase